MPTESQPIPKRIWVAAIAILALLGAVFLSNRPARTPEGTVVVETQEAFIEGMNVAESLSKVAFQKDIAGEPITKEDQENLRKAAIQLDALGRFRPHNIATFLGAGKAYRIVGDDELAKARFRQAIDNEIFDQSENGKLSVAEASYELSQLLVLSNELDKAKVAAEKAIALVPVSAIYVTARASVLVQMKRYDDARKDLQLALKIDPNLRPAQRLLKLIADAK